MLQSPLEVCTDLQIPARLRAASCHRPRARKEAAHTVIRATHISGCIGQVPPRVHIMLDQAETAFLLQ